MPKARLQRARSIRTASKRQGGAREVSAYAEGKSGGGDQPQRRLAVGRKVKNDSGASRRGKPQKRAAQCCLCVKRSCEMLEQRREPDGKALRFAQAACSDCGLGQFSHAWMIKDLCHPRNYKNY